MDIQQHPNGVRTRPATVSDQSRVFELIEQLTGEATNPQWDEVYTSHLRGERGAVIIAENDDGIHWRKPELGIFTFDGHADNNIVWDLHGA